MTKTKNTPYKLKYYPNDVEQKSEAKIALFPNKRAARKFIKENLECATMCSFYQLMPC